MRRHGTALRIALVPSALLLAACSDQSAPQPVVSPATPAELFDHTPAYPGYSWALDGRSAGPQVVATEAGPAHCGWQKATFLTLGRPPATAAPNAGTARQYIRDPLHVVDATRLRATLDLDAHLPPDARPTGLAYRGVAIYVASDAGTAVYVAGGGHVERWPRSDPMTICA